MRMLGPYSPGVGFLHVGRKIFRKRDPRSGNAVIGGWKTWSICILRVLSLPFLSIDDLNANRALRAGIYASRLAAISQPAVAHVALADHTALWVVLRHTVGAVPCAVLAANAGFRVVLHDASDRILLIGINRTADQA